MTTTAMLINIMITIINHIINIIKILFTIVWLFASLSPWISP